jgi:hypothetical protein
MVNGKTPMMAALDADSKLCILILMKVLYFMLACLVLELVYSFAGVITDFHTYGATDFLCWCLVCKH